MVGTGITVPRITVRLTQPATNRLGQVTVVRVNTHPILIGGTKVSLVDPFKIPEGQRAGPQLGQAERNIQPRSGAERPVLTRSNQFKMCQKAQRYEPHPKHDWQNSKNYTLLCEGVPEPEDQDPCAWVVNSAGHMCGEAAPAMIRVKTSTADVRIRVCPLHKHVHDNQAVTRRSDRSMHNQSS